MMSTATGFCFAGTDEGIHHIRSAIRNPAKNPATSNEEACSDAEQYAIRCVVVGAKHRNNNKFV
jgi:hypothetical protein